MTCCLGDASNSAVAHMRPYSTSIQFISSLHGNKIYFFLCFAKLNDLCSNIMLLTPKIHFLLIFVFKSFFFFFSGFQVYAHVYLRIW